MLCKLDIDYSQLPMTYKRRHSGEEMLYFVEFCIVLRFGLTELEAMVSWKENVSPLFVLLYPLYLRNVAGRVLNDGVPRRLYTIPAMTPKAESSV